MLYEEVLTYFGGYGLKRQTAEKAVCHSPLRRDTDASLWLTKRADGGTLLYDFGAPDQTEAILAAVGLQLRDLYNDPSQGSGTRKKDWRGYAERYVNRNTGKGLRLTDVYHYKTASGEYAYTKLRFEDAKGTKELRFGTLKDDIFTFSSDRSNAHKVNRERTFYGDYSAIKKAKAEGQNVFICEGEKDVNTLSLYGFAACTVGSSGDAEKYRGVYAELLDGANVVILADNDEPGKKAAAASLEACQKTAAAVKIIVPCKEAAGEDITDYFRTHHKTLKEFEAMIQTADDTAEAQAVKDAQPAAESAQPEQPKVELKSFSDIYESDIQPPLFFIDGIVPEGLTIISAMPKIGKSWLAMDMAFSVAEGKPFLGRETKQCDTLYIDLENEHSPIKGRLEYVKKAAPGYELPLNAKVLTAADIQRTFGLEYLPIINDGFEDVLTAIIDQYPAVRLFIIDTYQYIAAEPKRSESQYKTDSRSLTALRRIAQARHVAIVLIHHNTKLQHPEDVFSNISGSVGMQGATDANVVITKDKRKDTTAVLNVSGRHAASLELQLIEKQDSWPFWESTGHAPEQEDATEKDLLKEYEQSEVRAAVLAIAEGLQKPFATKAALIKDLANNMGVPVIGDPKSVGRALKKFQPLFSKRDGVRITFTSNGDTNSLTWTIHPVWKDADSPEDTEG